MLSGSTLLRHLAQFYCAIYTQTVSGVIDLKLPASRTEAVGHSLGCGTGSAYGLATGSNVTCFSGAALHPNSIQYFSGQNTGQQPIIRNYAIQGEIVTRVIPPKKAST